MNHEFFEYETVAASTSAQVLGSAGARGGRLHKLTCIIATSATSNVILTDGATNITILPNSVIGLGPRDVELNITAATGPFKITTSAGVSVIAVGKFY